MEKSALSRLRLRKRGAPQANLHPPRPSSPLLSLFILASAYPSALLPLSGLAAFRLEPLQTAAKPTRVTDPLQLVIVFVALCRLNATTTARRTTCSRG